MNIYVSPKGIAWTHGSLMTEYIRNLQIDNPNQNNTIKIVHTFIHIYFKIVFHQIDERPGAWKKSLKKGEIPEPIPQKQTKQVFLHGINFDVVDRHALTVSS